MTPEDVLWSLRRVVKLNFGNAATLTEYGFTKDTVDQRIVAPDANTVVFKLKEQGLSDDADPPGDRRQPRRCRDGHEDHHGR